MSQWANTLCTKPDYLSWIPGTPHNSHPLTPTSCTLIPICVHEHMNIITNE